MPYKSNINSKAQVARDRKKALNDFRRTAKEKLIEDKKWEDNDKHYKASLERKADAQQKLDLKLQKKLELRQLEQDEKKSLEHLGKSNSKNNTMSKQKLTQAEISMRLLKSIDLKHANKIDEEDKLEENLNKLIPESTMNLENDDRTVVNVSGINNALNYLDSTPSELHPERRMKASHLAFEEKMFPILMSEHPSLKRSQIKEMIWNMWKKSPENPLNNSANNFK